ncbi:MAG: ATP-binding protein [Prochloraceae cyanobacterium]|nr:ATP-binding protein [Prochloraceae cyanobacterium]
MNFLETSSSLEIFGRQAQFQQITQALARDADLLIAGVPGSGRRTLVRRAVKEVGAKILDIDCVRATNSQRFLQLLCEGMNKTFKSAASHEVVEQWLSEEGAELFERIEKAKFKPKFVALQEQQWLAYKLLLQLPQLVAKTIGRQMVIILHGFPHIRNWDRQGTWEAFLRKEIKHQTEVSYVLVATIGEISSQEDLYLEIVQLTPLADEVVAAWAQEVLRKEGLTFNPRSNSLKLFLDAVQGHIGDASSLLKRLTTLRVEKGLINSEDVEQTIQEILSNLSTTFESLLTLLPANQAHLLECLAIDPTEKPQSKEYINRHYLSRGGSLQGAIAGLQNKGLIYGAELGYKIALPLFALWLRQRLS